MRGTDGRTDGRMDGRTDGRTNERYGRDQIRNGRWSIEACQHPLSTEQSRSGHLLRLPHSLFVWSFRLFFATFSIYLTLPTSTLLPRRGSLNFSPASLLLFTPFPLPFFSSPSFHRIFVASFSPHHSLAVILHHFPAVLTSRSTALHPDVGRVHGTPRCQHTIQLLSTTPAADTASIYTNLATTTDLYVYVCGTLSCWCRSVPTSYEMRPAASRGTVHGRALIESRARISSFSPLSLFGRSAVDVDVRVSLVTFSC